MKEYPVFEELIPDQPRQNLREFIDTLREGGYDVIDGHTPDPDLIDPMGKAVETWCENYPYSERLSREEYELEKYYLQIELLKLQHWDEDTGKIIIVVFAGRDAAGTVRTIERFTEYMNPRTARTVALNKPNDRERGQWYFQRYINHFPTAGEIVLFDRSWYNRAGVERVMGFSNEDQYHTFMNQAPVLEKLLV